MYQDLLPPLTTRALVGDPEFDRFCSGVFSSMARRDQRHKGAAYVAGLLRAQGRKSLQNIASATGLPGVNEQSLHHFVSDSNWSWRTVRQDLARELSVADSADALVVHDATRVSGASSRPTTPGNEHRNRARPQGMSGLWAASSAGSYALTWWRNAEVPASEALRHTNGAPVPHRPERLLIEAYRDMTAGANHPVPLVVDAREMSSSRLLRGIGGSVPALLRVRPGQLAWPTSPAEPVSRRPISVQQLALSNSHLRRVVNGGERGGPGQLTLRLGLQLPERIAEAPAGSAEPLTAELFCLGAPRRMWPQQYWVAWGPRLDLDLQVYLTSLHEQVAREAGTAARSLGVDDYRGRTCSGVHRHATLVGVAQAYWSAHLARTGDGHRGPAGPDLEGSTEIGSLPCRCGQAE